MGGVKKGQKYAYVILEWSLMQSTWNSTKTQKQGLKLVKQIGKKIQDATGEKLSTFYLFQNISIAILRGNSQCVEGCVKDRSSGLEGLFNFHVQEAEEV